MRNCRRKIFLFSSQIEPDTIVNQHSDNKRHDDNQTEGRDKNRVALVILTNYVADCSFFYCLTTKIWDDTFNNQHINTNSSTIFSNF